MYARLRVVCTTIVVTATVLWPFAVHALEIDAPDMALTLVPVEIVVVDAPADAQVTLRAGNSTQQQSADHDGRAVFADVLIDSSGTISLAASAEGETTSSELRVLPGWVSVVPALLAIAVALILRNVVPALLLGLWFGATALQTFTLAGAGRGLLDSFQVFVAGAVADGDHAAIILFTMMIGGMVGIITRNGGMASIVRVIVSRAKSAVGGQIAVWLMGMMIFFDDYSNTLVVGNTARPITDHLKISREKLAYIVDSTAAPVVCIALVTTWIGYEVSLIDQAMRGIEGLSGMAGYTVFLHSIPYSFYPILAVIFVFIVAASGRDIGPMYKAEVRARGGQVLSDMGDETPAMQSDDLEAKPNIPLRGINAFVPIIVLIVALPVGLYATGDGDTFSEIIRTVDIYKAMMWASFVGALTAAVMSMGQGILSAHETVDAWYGGARATLFGMIVLVLAWSLSSVTAALNAQGYLVNILGDSLPIALVPAVVFVLSAITAFSTGTSWGTMGILIPLVVPLAWAVMSINGMTGAADMHVLHSSVACCLAGAVWGDHCSPISDTTVLSSLASGCNHIEHVRTQLPYALLVGVVALLIGTVPGGYGLPAWISIIVGIAVLIAVMRLFGRNADDAVQS